MIRFFSKLFKRGDFMTRADKWYYSKVIKTWLWSAFAFVIIAWVGTNLVLCALSMNVGSNFDIGYQATAPVMLPTGKEFNLILRKIDEGDIFSVPDYTIESIVFDKFTNQQMDFYKGANGKNMIAGADKTALNVDDEIYLYRANKGANIYVLSNKDIYANTDSSYMFCGLCCSSQEGYPDGVSITFNNFHTDNVENMSYMFAGDLELLQGFITLDLSGWNTSKVTDMSHMFRSCANLTSLNLTGWDTKNVTTMAGMFNNLTYWDRLTLELDLSSFDTRNVIDMSYMFVGLYNYEDWIGLVDKLTTIYVSDKFVVDQVKKSIWMFDWCKSLVGGQGTAWNESNPADKTYARIDGKDGKPGYFTEKPYSGK